MAKTNERFLEIGALRTDSRIICKDKGEEREYILNNPSRMEVLFLQSDGELFKTTDKDRRCDFIIAFHATLPTAILVELKGRHIDRALSQIETCLAFMQRDYSYKRFYGRIVSSGKTPAILSTDQIKLKNKFKALGGDLQIKTTRMEEHIHPDGSVSSKRR